MSEPGSWAFLRSRRWLMYWAMLAVFSVVCVFLGNWQFARRAEAQAEIARIDANYDAPPVALAEALPTLAAFDEDRNKWQQIEVTGRYLAEEQLLARNRPFVDQVGFNILAPFVTQNGEVIIIDRGWIPQSTGSDETGVIPDPPKGEVSVVARLKAGEPTIAGRTPSENTVGTINLPEIEEMLSRPTYTGAYGLLVSESPTTEHGLLSERPARDEGPHLSYALQWYVFIVIAALGTLYGARQEHRSAIPPDVARDRDALRRSKRGRTDAEDEDALIDAQLHS